LAIAEDLAVDHDLHAEMSTGAHMVGAAQGAGQGVAASSGSTTFPVGARQRTALISWAAFAATFAGVRA